MTTTVTRQRLFGVVALLLAVAALAFAVATAVPLVRYSSYTAQGVSMSPTIRPGHHLRTSSGDNAGAGDIVVLRPPADAGLGLASTVVTRVVAVAGQAVSVRSGRLLLNGRPAVEPYLAPGTETRAAKTVRVPVGAVYVLGDNRMNSIGSNFYGPVPVGSIRGRVVDVDSPGTAAVVLRLAGGLAVTVALAVVAWRWIRVPNPPRRRAGRRG